MPSYGRRRSIVRRDGERDLYLLLGVDRRASPAEITSAYRRAARQTHPDSRPDEPSGAERFKAVTDAYETLRDPSRRSEYDRTHPVVTRVPHRVAAPADRIDLRPAAGAARPPLWAGPVEIVPPAGRGPQAPAASDELAALLSVLLRWPRGGGW